MNCLTTLTIIALSFGGTLSFQHPEIDINRLKLLTNDVTSYSQRLVSTHSRRNNALIDSTNSHRRASIWHAKNTVNKNPIKVYQPREDPRIFYQSNSYIKNDDAAKSNRELPITYPGKEVVWARDTYGQKSARLMRKRGRNNGGYCIKCPHDRTIIAKAGSDRVLLQSPRLMTCRGRPAPRNVHFLHMYGPHFGSLVKRGIHTILGRIYDQEGTKTLKQCKIEVTVITQGCPTPKYLRTQCADHHPSCNFTCSDSRMELQGERSLVCGDDLNWLGDLPVCKANTWCEPPPPPSHGRVHCQGATSGSALMEGSQCRVRCQRAWRSNTRAVPIYCRQGTWTKSLTCQPKTRK